MALRIFKYQQRTLSEIGAIEMREVIVTPEEYSRLKDIETRFTIIKQEMLHADYCPLHTQIILGIENAFENEYKKKPGIKYEPIRKQEDKQ
jgi:hypothetical protein